MDFGELDGSWCLLAPSPVETSLAQTSVDTTEISAPSGPKYRTSPSSYRTNSDPFRGPERSASSTIGTVCGNPETGCSSRGGSWRCCSETSATPKATPIAGEECSPSEHCLAYYPEFLEFERLWKARACRRRWSRRPDSSHSSNHWRTRTAPAARTSSGGHMERNPCRWSHWRKSEDRKAITPPPPLLLSFEHWQQHRLSPLSSVKIF